MEYDLDDQDERWLEQHQCTYKSKTKPPFKIDEETLETTIDFLEKCSFKEVVHNACGSNSLDGVPAVSASGRPNEHRRRKQSNWDMLRLWQEINDR